MMETALAKILTILANHGPFAIVSVVFIALYVIDRKSHNSRVTELETLHSQEIKDEKDRHDVTAKRLHQLSMESIKADTEHTAAIQALTKVLDSVDRRLE
jgi:hypothetical protein